MELNVKLLAYVYITLFQLILLFAAHVEDIFLIFDKSGNTNKPTQNWNDYVLQDVSN
jgi:hypothetical protein